MRMLTIDGIERDIAKALSSYLNNYGGRPSLII